MNTTLISANNALNGFLKENRKDRGKITTIFDNEWLSVKEIKAPEMDINGYVYSHESRCEGKIIAVLPFRKKDGYVEFGVRHEITPAWGLKPVYSALTGGYEGGDPRDTAVMEVKEEAGFDVDKDDLIDLGNSYASKSADTIYYLYAADVTGLEEGEAAGDGSTLDAEGTIKWFKHFPQSDDPQVSTMYLRLMRLFDGQDF